MARKLCDILADLDVRIEKRAQAKQASAPASDDGDVEKLAETLLKSAPRRPPNNPDPRAYMTEVEKIAHSMAVVETLLGGEPLAKICDFEKKAIDAGVPSDEVQDLVTKYATRTQAGGKVVDFMKGLGSGVASRLESFGKMTGEGRPEIAGEILGRVAPAVGLAGTGMYLGSKHKERQIRKKMGIH